MIDRLAWLCSQIKGEMCANIGRHFQAFHTSHINGQLEFEVLVIGHGLVSLLTVLTLVSFKFVVAVV